MEASGHSPKMSEPTPRRRGTFKSLLRGVVSGIRQRTDATPPASSTPAAIPAALPPPAAIRAALALEQERLEEHAKWSREVRGESAALGHIDSLFGPHFILDAETVYDKLSSSDDEQKVYCAESLIHESHKLYMHGTPTYNRFSCLESQELAPGMAFGPPPGLSEPTCRERKQARNLLSGNRFRSPGMPMAL
jgi:hypothetical protein